MAEILQNSPRVVLRMGSNGPILRGTLGRGGLQAASASRLQSPRAISFPRHDAGWKALHSWAMVASFPS